LHILGKNEGLVWFAKGWANYPITAYRPLTEPQPNRHRLPTDSTDKVDLTDLTAYRTDALPYLRNTKKKKKNYYFLFSFNFFLKEEENETQSPTQWLIDHPLRWLANHKGRQGWPHHHQNASWWDGCGHPPFFNFFFFYNLSLYIYI